MRITWISRQLFCNIFYTSSHQIPRPLFATWQTLGLPQLTTGPGLLPSWEVACSDGALVRCLFPKKKKNNVDKRKTLKL